MGAFYASDILWQQVASPEISQRARGRGRRAARTCPPGNFMPENAGTEFLDQTEIATLFAGRQRRRRRRRPARPRAGRRPRSATRPSIPTRPPPSPTTPARSSVEVQNQGESEASSVGVDGHGRRHRAVETTIESLGPGETGTAKLPLEPAASARLRGDDRGPGRAGGGRGRQQQQRVLLHGHLRDAVVARRLPRSPGDLHRGRPSRRGGRRGGLEPIPTPSVYAAIAGRRGRRGRPRLRPLRELDRGRGARDARHPRLRRRRASTLVGEHDFPISHCLIARAEVPLEQIEVVLSHPQGTAQCARFIREQLPGAEVRAASSTAEAVRLVSEQRGALGRARAPPRRPSATAAPSCATASRTSPTTSPASSGSRPRGPSPRATGPGGPR